MRRSQLFIKTRKEPPADEPSKNAQLLIRSGYIHKEMAGVYSYLPLGKRTLEKIEAIIREEMEALGGQEVILSSLQDHELWRSTDRWDSQKVDVWFKSQLQSGGEVGFAWSHEEPMTRMIRQFVSSYQDLPVFTFQFQNKLRNELRAKSGLLRGREFVMKDMYSFTRNQQEHENFYSQAIAAYEKVYQRLGIGDSTVKTFASGGAFSKFSDEFQTLSEIGEDTIYYDESKKLAVNKEVLTDQVLAELGLRKEDLVERTAVEVGNMFTFGTSKSEPLGLKFTDETGNSQLVYTGSYGIGVSRLMGLLAEHFADDTGLAWPKNVAPYQVYLVRIGNEPALTAASDELYNRLTAAGVEVLYDDRDVRTGEMFADADLIGLPYRLVISGKTLETNSCELKHRADEKTELVTLEKIQETLVNLA